MRLGGQHATVNRTPGGSHAGTGWEYVVGCVVVGSVVVAGLYRYPGRAVPGQAVVWHETTLTVVEHLDLRLSHKVPLLACGMKNLTGSYRVTRSCLSSRASRLRISAGSTCDIRTCVIEGVDVVVRAIERIPKH
jgi:hypothetical protein